MRVFGGKGGGPHAYLEYAGVSPAVIFVQIMTAGPRLAPSQDWLLQFPGDEGAGYLSGITDTFIPTRA